MELDELYQEVILDHSKRPRNRREMPGCTAAAHGDNPSCGDEITMFVKLGPEEIIEDVAFVGSGCAISQSAASLLTVQVKGKKTEEAVGIVHAFHELLGPENDLKSGAENGKLGNLRALKGVRKFPQRLKCATLASHALEDALTAASTLKSES